MNRKGKGTKHERELVHMLWREGFACIRSAGSGSMRHPSPDILGGNRLRKVGIECKSSSSDAIYIPTESLEQLKTFCTQFGAEPWVAVRFNGEEWYLLNPEDIEKTERSYVISKKKAKEYGLLFEEFVKTERLEQP